MESTTTDREFEIAGTIIRQIGGRTIMAISGRRPTYTVRDGNVVVIMRVSNGYTVEVEYTALDLYTVRRVFTRAGKRFDKGETTMVHASELSEECWKAHAFRSYEYGSAA